MFHYDAGLFLTAARLGVDVRRRQPRCFVSHAHADHIARHELALATRGTACLYRHRLGTHYRVQEMTYDVPVEFGSMRLTACSAGHCLGSAMLLGAWCGLVLNSFFIDTLHFRLLWVLAALIWIGAARGRRAGRAPARGWP